MAKFTMIFFNETRSSDVDVVKVKLHARLTNCYGSLVPRDKNKEKESLQSIALYVQVVVQLDSYSFIIVKLLIMYLCC